MSLIRFLLERAQREYTAGLRTAAPIRLTPGQSAEFQREQGCDSFELNTCRGAQRIERIDHHIRATGDNVILCPRDDLFQETDSAVGIQLVSTANSVTSVPDNIGCVEVISVGPLVTCVQPGDIAFLDFFRVKQGYIVANEECYIAGGDAFSALYDKARQDILPLANNVVTRAAKDSFAVSLSGSELIRPSDIVLTDGFTSGKTSRGSAAAKTVYHEVVAIGALTARPRPGVMTVAERRLLDLVTRDNKVKCCDTYGDYEAAAINAIIEERKRGRTPDLLVGDLVGVCEDIALKVRVRGEYRWIAPYDNVLAVIEDKKIAEESRRRNPPRKLVSLH